MIGFGVRNAGPSAAPIPLVRALALHQWDVVLLRDFPPHFFQDFTGSFASFHEDRIMRFETQKYVFFIVWRVRNRQKAIVFGGNANVWEKSLLLQNQSVGDAFSESATYFVISFEGIIRSTITVSSSM